MLFLHSSIDIGKSRAAERKTIQTETKLLGTIFGVSVCFPSFGIGRRRGSLNGSQSSLRGCGFASRGGTDVDAIEPGGFADGGEVVGPDRVDLVATLLCWSFVVLCLF